MIRECEEPTGEARRRVGGRGPQAMVAGLQSVPRLRGVFQVAGMLAELYAQVQVRVGNIHPQDGTGAYRRALREAIHASRRELVTCTAVANRFFLILNPKVLDAMEVGGWRRDLVNRLRADAAEMIEQDGYALLDRPLIVVLAGSDDVPEGQVDYDFCYDLPRAYPYVKVVSGLGQGERCLIAEMPFTIGRRPDSVFRIAPHASRVSGTHGEIRESAEGWVYVDLWSSNGSFRGGERLEPGRPTALRDGERIVLGEGPDGVEIEFELS